EPQPRRPRDGGAGPPPGRRRAAAAAGHDRARRLPHRQRGVRRGRPRADQRGARLGAVDARRPDERRRAADALLARGRRPGAGAGSRGHAPAGLPHPRRDARPVRRHGGRRSGRPDLVPGVRALQVRRHRPGRLGALEGQGDGQPGRPRSDRPRSSAGHRRPRPPGGALIMDFALSEKAQRTCDEMWDFMRAHVFPAEPVWAAHLAEHGPHAYPPVMEELKAEARRRGLWNLFLPKLSGLSNLDYASVAEVTGWSPVIAPEAINCQAPDTGNMETLELFATPEQRDRWLEPLLNGRIRSAFAMTEPEVASSDATNISTSITRDGDDYVINGRKWWITGV